MFAYETQIKMLGLILSLKYHAITRLGKKYHSCAIIAQSEHSDTKQTSVSWSLVAMQETNLVIKMRSNWEKLEPTEQRVVSHQSLNEELRLNMNILLCTCATTTSLSNCSKRSKMLLTFSKQIVVVENKRGFCWNKILSRFFRKEFNIMIQDSEKEETIMLLLFEQITHLK